MLVRAGCRNDLSAMATVFRRAALTNERDRDLLSEHPEFMELVPPAEEDLVLVADLEGRIVGFATAKTLGDDALEVADIFVDPDHMRSGVGRALIETIVREAIRSGRSVIEVDANRHAVAFYCRLGFLAVREVQSEFGTAVRMA